MERRAWRIILFMAVGIALLKIAYGSSFRPSGLLMASREPLQNIFLMAGQFVALMVAIIVNRRMNGRFFLKRSLVFAVGVSLSLLSLAYAFFPQLNGVAVIYGLFYGVLLLGWGLIACSVAPRVSALAITAGFLLYSVSVSCVEALNPEISQMATEALAVFAPAGSSVMLLLLLMKNRGITDDRVLRPWGGEVKTQVRMIPVQPLVALVLCVLATSYSSVFLGNWLDLVEMGGVLWLFPLVQLVLLVALLISFLVFKHDSPLSLWPFLILIVLVSIFAFSSLSGHNLDLVSGFAEAVTYCLRLFGWYFACSIVFSKGLSAIPPFGIIYMLVAFSPRVTSMLISPLLSRLPQEAFSLVGSIGVVAFAVVLLAAAFIMLMNQFRAGRDPFDFEEETFDKSNEQSAITADENSAPNVAMPEDSSRSDEEYPSIDVLATRFGLSQREAEVLQLVLKGYTWPMIAEKLYISLNTAQSHQRNIYRKLGVHKKSELIALCQ